MKIYKIIYNNVIIRSFKDDNHIYVVLNDLSDSIGYKDRGTIIDLLPKEIIKQFVLPVKKYSVWHNCVCENAIPYIINKSRKHNAKTTCINIWIKIAQLIHKENNKNKE